MTLNRTPLNGPTRFWGRNRSLFFAEEDAREDVEGADSDGRGMELKTGQIKDVLDRPQSVLISLHAVVSE